MENSVEVSQKSKNRTTIWSCNSTPGYISGGKKKKKHQFEEIHAAQCSQQHYSQLPRYESKKVYIKRWVDKEDVSIYMEWNTTQPLKKNKVLLLAETYIDWEGIMLIEISQSQILWDTTYKWNQKDTTN